MKWFTPSLLRTGGVHCRLWSHHHLSRGRGGSLPVLLGHRSLFVDYWDHLSLHWFWPWVHVGAHHGATLVQVKLVLCDYYGKTSVSSHQEQPPGGELYECLWCEPCLYSHNLAGAEQWEDCRPCSAQMPNHRPGDGLPELPAVQHHHPVVLQLWRSGAHVCVPAHLQHLPAGGSYCFCGR